MKIHSALVFSVVSFGALVAAGDQAEAKPSSVAEAIARMPKTHPRLLVRGQVDFDAVNARAKTDPLMGQLREIVLATAEICRTNPPVRGMNGMRMTGQQEFAESAIALAMACRLTGDRRFGEALRDHMLAVSDWPDWNPSHYLDVAEILLGLSVGYDWTHDLLTEAERAKIRRVMIEKGFNTRDVNGWWKYASNNWPQVCWGMIGLTAVAIGAEEPEVAEKMIGEILRSLDPCLSVYAPHGAYPEGPYYWGYGTGYFLYMVAAFDAAFGTDFGLFDKPGIAETGLFIDAMTGPSGDFWNFSDGHWVRKARVCDAYLARKTGRRGILAFDIASIRRFLTEYAKFPLATQTKEIRRFIDDHVPLWLLWGDFNAVDEASAGAIDYSSGGRNPVVVMRSSRDRNAAYLGLKGGKSCANHGHMDQGSILWESDGYRWAMDIGPQDYAALEKAGVNLWAVGQNGDRWKIFRMNNLSHNLVTVDEKLFSVTGFCDFVATSFAPDIASATLDLTPAVHTYAKRGSRRCTLDRKTRIGTVEDELDGLAPGSKVRWAIVTPSRYVRIRGDDVVLETPDGRNLTLRKEMPEGVAWQVEDMSFQPNPWDNRNDGWTLVTFTAKSADDGKFRSRVRFIPGEPQGGILMTEDVVLDAVLDRKPDEFDRNYVLRYGTRIPEQMEDVRTNGLHSVVYTGNLRNLTTCGVRKLKSTGVKVYLLNGNRAEAMRVAALVGADGICAGKEKGLEAERVRVKARSVKLNLIKRNASGGK